jgi:ABC-2 type transport system ATP-binding protein
VIEVRGLTNCYVTHLPVDNVKFTMTEGDIFGIRGVNGGRQDGHRRVPPGFAPTDCGHMRVLGADPRTAGWRLRARVGSQLQAARSDRVEEAVRLCGDGDPWSADGPLDTWNLGRPRRSSFASLSGGPQQRPMLALAPLNEPEVASFDTLTQRRDRPARGDVWGAPWSLDIASRSKRRTSRAGPMSPISVDDEPRQGRPMGGSESLGAELSHLHPMPTGPPMGSPPPVPYRDVCR